MAVVDRSGEELRPAFPRWMQRLDPSLAAAGENALFEAFRRRRVLHRGRRWLRWTKGGAGSLGITAITVGAVLVTILLAFFVGCLAWILLAMTMPFIMLVAQRQKRHATFLPKRLESVFGARGVSVNVATDMWLAGHRGRDVLQAIHLEQRARQRFAPPVVAAFACALTLLLCGGAAVSEPPLRVAAPALALAMCAFWIASARVSYMMGADGACNKSLEPRARNWESGNAAEAAVMNFGMSFVRSVNAWVMLPLVLVLMAGTIGAISVGITISDKPGAGHAGAQWALWIGTATWAAGAIAVTLMGPLLRRNAHKRLAKCLEEADFAFDRFMASVVNEDPDGDRWARWLHMDYLPKQRQWLQAQGSAQGSAQGATPEAPPSG